MQRDFMHFQQTKWLYFFCSMLFLHYKAYSYGHHHVTCISQSQETGKIKTIILTCLGGGLKNYITTYMYAKECLVILPLELVATWLVNYGRNFGMNKLQPYLTQTNRQSLSLQQAWHPLLVQILQQPLQTYLLLRQIAFGRLEPKKQQHNNPVQKCQTAHKLYSYFSAH